MKLPNTILSITVASVSMLSCTQALTEVSEPQDFSAEVSKINANVTAMQAVVQGQVINSVRESGSTYDLLLANGTELKIDNQIYSNAPAVDFHDGKWFIGKTAVTDGDNLDILPVFSVNEAGKWTVSAADNEMILDKAVSTEGEEYFTGIEHSEKEFRLTTRSAARFAAPVAAGFLFKIDAAGVQNFVLGQTRSYNITKNGISAATVVAPEGWEVSLSENQIKITAPHSSVTKAVVADSKTDVSVIAVSTAGYVTIAKVLTELDETASATDPFAMLSMGEVKAYTAKVNVTVQNQSAWYWMLKKASEAAPSVEEMKAATAGTSTEVVLSTEPETGYVFYVLPVKDAKDGKIAKVEFTTAAITSYYEAWEAGAEIKIGSQTYSKAKNGKATLITGNKTQQIWDGWFNDGTFGAIFVDEGSTAFFKNAGYNKPVVVLGNIPGTRPVVEIREQIAVNGVDLAFKNVSVKMVDGMAGGKFIYSNTEMGRMILDDCYVDLKYPVLQRFNNAGSTSGKMAGIEITDCDVCVNWAADNTAQPLLVNTHAGGAELGNVTIKNNVFWSKGDKKEFHLVASQYSGKYTKFNSIVVENNTFYNVNNGLASKGRDRAMIVASALNDISLSGNIVYDTSPDSKSVSTKPHLTWLAVLKTADGGIGTGVAAAAMTNTLGNLVNIAELCTVTDGVTSEWTKGMINLIIWKAGGWSEIASWKNPFAVENVENGYFVTTDEYKAYGAQRK
ncbi:MAG: DUF4988 domain-containing protein [Bacteroides sp.]|nr:DUF4988 domain-containing protein [Bacteroides sp.]MCI7548130.1 DUF4988 domain-containing protein [Bacteroides sp.]